MTAACAAGLALAAGFGSCGSAADADTSAPYSPFVRGPQAKRVLWGDTHLHTSLSLDARAFGVRLDPEAAYRFARG